jgi:hypothetical protein
LQQWFSHPLGLSTFGHRASSVAGALLPTSKRILSHKLSTVASWVFITPISQLVQKVWESQCSSECPHSLDTVELRVRDMGLYQVPFQCWLLLRAGSKG